jgi:hypothetical protein
MIPQSILRQAPKHFLSCTKGRGENSMQIHPTPCRTPPHLRRPTQNRAMPLGIRKVGNRTRLAAGTRFCPFLISRGLPARQDLCLIPLAPVGLVCLLGLQAAHWAQIGTCWRRLPFLLRALKVWSIQMRSKRWQIKPHADFHCTIIFVSQNMYLKCSIRFRSTTNNAETHVCADGIKSSLSSIFPSLIFIFSCRHSYYSCSPVGTCSKSPSILSLLEYMAKSRS